MDTDVSRGIAAVVGYMTDFVSSIPIEAQGSLKAYPQLRKGDLTSAQR